MKNELNPNQALLLWNMITGETLAAREPSLSEAKPKLKVKQERDPLLDAGYLTLEKRGRTTHLLLADKAWAWAESCSDVELPNDPGSRALQGLLRKLLPHLRKKRMALATLFAPEALKKGRARATTRNTAKAASKPATERKPRAKAARKTSKRAGLSASVAPETNTSPESLSHRVEAACLELANGQRKQRVRLSDLRAALSDVSRASFEQTLLEMQDQGRCVLYREDNTAALTAADHDAALFVGNAPRHLVYLEA